MVKDFQKKKEIVETKLEIIARFSIFFNFLKNALFLQVQDFKECLIDFLDVIFINLFNNCFTFGIVYFMLKYKNINSEITKIDLILVIFGYMWLLITYFLIVSYILNFFLNFKNFTQTLLMFSYSFVYLPVTLLLIQFCEFQMFGPIILTMLCISLVTVYIFNNLTNNIENMTYEKQFILSLISFVISFVLIIFYMKTLYLFFYPSTTKLRFYKNVFFHM